ncbi:phosphoglycerate mutase [Sedimentibacter sp.]|uniref:phosphoglycerate mutase n=1 Tax=Sedimentibacter sp. TaxID=1960295 RepID=UPI0028A7DE08|nr:phosphoglycerate mutase [Sedimentibacter sp.]
MKQILVILDGLSEEKVKDLGFMTPLQYAVTPTIDEFIQQGKYEKKSFCVPDRKPDSLGCILSILGVKEEFIPQNRAYIEALASDINIDDDEIALRCNLIKVNNNKLESFNGGNLNNNEMKNAAERVSISEKIRFHHISSYRNIIVAKKCDEILSVNNYPPHEYIGENMNVLLEDIIKIDVLRNFIENSRFFTGDDEYMFYPWGASEKIKLPSFYELHKMTCSCICGAEIVKGIAKLMDIIVPELKHSTADVDTDLNEKAEAALNEIKNHDIVIVHINGTDEVSHRKDIFSKVKFIERIDREFLSAIYENAEKNTAITVLSDHQTSSVTGRHEGGLVDVITVIKNDGGNHGKSNNGTRNNI